MVKTPKVSIPISGAAIPRAVEVVQSRIVWGVGGVVVKVCGGLVLQQEALGAAGRTWVKAHCNGSARLPVGEGSRWVPIPLQLPSGSVELVEQPDKDLATDGRV